jgi:Transposase IS116/IS110/IS902 family
LALGALKHKRPPLELALTGQFTAHHGTLLGLLLELIEGLDRQMATLDQQIGALVAPLQAQIAQLDSIPGVDIMAARDMLAEIGTDMSRFGDAARLASWAGVCPGNHESAGKQYRGKTRKGNRYLRRILVPCAWGARTTPTFLGRTFRRLEVRIGKKKAALAIAHNILVIVYHLLATGSCYEEARYDHCHPKQEARERQRAIKALERLGYTVTVERAASLPGGRLISSASVIGWPCVPKQRQSLSGSGVSTRSQLFRRNPMECCTSRCLTGHQTSAICHYRLFENPPFFLDCRWHPYRKWAISCSMVRRWSGVSAPFSTPNGSAAKASSR